MLLLLICTCCFITTAVELYDCKHINDITADVLSNHKIFAITMAALKISQ